MLAAAALFLLNASLTFGNVWPTPKIRWQAALSVELAVVVLLMAAWPARAGRWARRLLPAAWVLLVAGHYLDVTAPGLYGRDFNLYWDSQHLGNVAAMLAAAVPAWQIVAAAAGVVVLIAALFWLSALALRAVAAAVQGPAWRYGLGAIAAVVVVLFVAQAAAPGLAKGVAFADPSSGAYLRQARYVVSMVGPWKAAPNLGATPRMEAADLRGLEGADVMLAFVESYGAVNFDKPAFAAALADSRADLEAAAHEAGRTIVSAFVVSPTFGASSWLAHLSLLSGVKVTDQYSYTSLMATTRDTMVKAFARGGYRTIGLMPGMRQPWPEGAFYGFDLIYGHDLLAYTGPHFGWWEIPDQFALAKVDELERASASRAPVFIVFPTSTSHAPFGPVAPYLPDWSRSLDADAYDTPEAKATLASPPALVDLTPSYLRSINYEYRAFAGYVRAHAGENLVLILIGDHQPPAAVSGNGQPHDVPIHVITSRPHVLDVLRAHGFRDGLTPGRPVEGEMHALVPTFFEAFAASEGGLGLRVPRGAQPADVHRERPRQQPQRDGRDQR